MEALVHNSFLPISQSITDKLGLSISLLKIFKLEILKKIPFQNCAGPDLRHSIYVKSNLATIQNKTDMIISFS